MKDSLRLRYSPGVALWPGEPPFRRAGPAAGSLWPERLGALACGDWEGRDLTTRSLEVWELLLLLETRFSPPRPRLGRGDPSAHRERGAGRRATPIPLPECRPFPKLRVCPTLKLFFSFLSCVSSAVFFGNLFSHNSPPPRRLVAVHGTRANYIGVPCRKDILEENLILAVKPCVPDHIQLRYFVGNLDNRINYL